MAPLVPPRTRSSVRLSRQQNANVGGVGVAVVQRPVESIELPFIKDHIQALINEEGDWKASPLLTRDSYVDLIVARMEAVRHPPTESNPEGGALLYIRRGYVKKFKLEITKMEQAELAIERRRVKEERERVERDRRSLEEEREQGLGLVEGEDEVENQSNPEGEEGRDLGEANESNELEVEEVRGLGEERGDQEEVQLDVGLHGDDRVPGELEEDELSYVNDDDSEPLGGLRIQATPRRAEFDDDQSDVLENATSLSPSSPPMTTSVPSGSRISLPPPSPLSQHSQSAELFPSSTSLNPSIANRSPGSHSEGEEEVRSMLMLMTTGEQDQGGEVSLPYDSQEGVGGTSEEEEFDDLDTFAVIDSPAPARSDGRGRVFAWSPLPPSSNYTNTKDISASSQLSPPPVMRVPSTSRLSPELPSDQPVPPSCPFHSTPSRLTAESSLFGGGCLFPLPTPESTSSGLDSSVDENDDALRMLGIKIAGEQKNDGSNSRRGWTEDDDVEDDELDSFSEPRSDQEEFESVTKDNAPEIDATTRAAVHSSARLLPRRSAALVSTPGGSPISSNLSPSTPSPCVSGDREKAQLVGISGEMDDKSGSASSLSNTTSTPAITDSHLSTPSSGASQASSVAYAYLPLSPTPGSANALQVRTRLPHLPHLSLAPTTNPSLVSTTFTQDDLASPPCNHQLITATSSSAPSQSNHELSTARSSTADSLVFAHVPATANITSSEAFPITPQRRPREARVRDRAALLPRDWDSDSELEINAGGPVQWEQTPGLAEVNTRVRRVLQQEPVGFVGVARELIGAVIFGRRS